MGKKRKNKKNKDLSYFIKCPHCEGTVQISKNEINCKIFRHGVYKKNNKQINPHLPRKECEQLIKNDEIHGCGKPFRFDGKTAEVCDYI